MSVVTTSLPESFTTSKLRSARLYRRFSRAPSCWRARSRTSRSGSPVSRHSSTTTHLSSSPPPSAPPRRSRRKCTTRLANLSARAARASAPPPACQPVKARLPRTSSGRPGAPASAAALSAPQYASQASRDSAKLYFRSSQVGGEAAPPAPASAQGTRTRHAAAGKAWKTPCAPRLPRPTSPSLPRRPTTLSSRPRAASHTFSWRPASSSRNSRPSSPRSRVEPSAS